MLLFLLCLLLAACSAAALPEGMQLIVLHGPGDEKITIRSEIADDDAERIQGLMDRTELAPKTGMLFVFPDAQPRSFWMKQTLIPLDVLFFDETGTYISHATMPPCTADPCPSYSSAGPAMWALELKGGETDRLGIGPGWSLQSKDQ